MRAVNIWGRRLLLGEARINDGWISYVSTSDATATVIIDAPIYFVRGAMEWRPIAQKAMALALLLRLQINEIMK